MKQFSIALNVIFVAIFLFAFGKSNKTANHSDNIPLLPYSSCTTCENPFIGITAQEFAEDIARYKTTHWSMTSKDAHLKGLWNISSFLPLKDKNGVTKSFKMVKDFQDSRSIWFPLSTIKEFICNIEKYATSQNLQIPIDSLGIRIYYAVYDTSYNKNRHSQHTLFMVPTNQNSNNEPEDFDPLLSSESQQVIYIPSFLSSAFGGKSGYSLNQQFLILSEESNNNPQSVYARNNGNLCPTKCPKVNTLDVVDNQYQTGVNY